MAVPSSPSTPLRARRNPRWLLAGLLAICLGGLGAAYVYTGVADAHSVLRVTRTVPRGQTISAQDLAVVSVGSTAGVDTVPADRLDDVVGQEALTDLPGGSLLVGASYGRSELAKGSVQLGLKIPAGRMPQRSMAAGVRVLLVPVASVTSAGAGKDPKAAPIEAVVAAVPVATIDATAWLLDVNVAADDAVTVARLAARDQLVVVREAGS